MENNTRENINKIEAIKICQETIVSFVSSIFKEENTIRSLLDDWKKSHFSNSVIDSLEKLYESIITSKIELTITSGHVEFFSGQPHLRVPSEILTSNSKQFIELFKNNWQYFFNTRKLQGELYQHTVLTKCLFNDIVSKSINRYKLVGRIIYEILVESCLEEDPNIFFSCIQVNSAALRNLLSNPDNQTKGLYEVYGTICQEDYYEKLFEDAKECKRLQMIEKEKEMMKIEMQKEEEMKMITNSKEETSNQ